MQHLHDHDQGLAHDIQQINAQRAQRRRALGWLAAVTGVGTLTLVACGGGGGGGDSTVASGSSSGSSSTSGGSTSSGSTSSSSCSVIPEETNGPYPADGSNTANGSIANALTLSGILRSDIRSSFGGSTTTAGGVPLTVKLTLQNANGACADLSGYAIYIWHCDREGRYSMYSSGVTGENYLRGVQVTGSDGTATFTTIFPACYSGRMPHIHIEVYASAATATSYTKALKTTQLAFPTDVCSTVYNGASGYSDSIANFSRISFATDMVFSDGVTQEMATVTGDITNGYTAALTFAVAA